MITVIGDVHGKIDKYLEIVNKAPDHTIQLGDMGIGFKDVHLPELSYKHKFFRGNHDNPALCKAHLNCVGDYGMYGLKCFYYAGAYSIDAASRIAYKTWWPDEEIVDSEIINHAVKIYDEIKPSIVFSHDCPRKLKNFITNADCEDKTSQVLQYMFDLHKPRLWIFGHHHISFRATIRNCRFICLSELETFNLEGV